MVLGLLPPKQIGGGRRANNEEKAEMEAKRARDLEGKKGDGPFIAFLLLNSSLSAPQYSPYFSSKELALIAAPVKLLHVCCVRL